MGNSGRRGPVPNRLPSGAGVVPERLTCVRHGAIALFVAGMGLQVITTETGDAEVEAEFSFVDAAPTTTTSTTTSTTTTTTTTTVPPPRTARLAFTGDLLPHGSVQRAGTATVEDGWDFILYAEVQPIIEGVDLAICHIETTISIDDTDLSGYPLFAAPRAFAEAARTLATTAAHSPNHSYDRGAQGALDTLTVMRDIGLPYAGQAASEEEDLAPVPTRSTTSRSPISRRPTPSTAFRCPPTSSTSDLIEPNILEEARIAKAAGAEFVIVSMHWGAEYRHEPIQSQNDWLEAVLPSDEVDLAIGHHAHVVQPVDKVGDEWVVFGLGNFPSNQSANCCVAASQTA